MKSQHPKIVVGSTPRFRSFMAQPFKSPNGIYQLRRKVPPELRDALGHEYKRSLKTRDGAEAKTRFAEEWATSEALFSQARAQAAGATSLSAQDMNLLAARWVRAEIRKLELSKKFDDWLVEGAMWSFEQGDHREGYTERLSVGDALAQGELEASELDRLVDKAAVAALKSNGVLMPSDAQSKTRLLQTFREHLIILSEFALTRHKGDWRAEAKLVADAPLSMEVRAQSLSSELSLLALFEKYSVDKKLNDGDTRGVRKTLATYRATLDQFIELFGDVPVNRISRETVREYRASLASLPSKGAGNRQLPAKQLLLKAKMEGLPRVSAATVRNKLQALSAVLSLGVRLGLIAENPVIAGGVGKAAAKAAGERSSSSRRVKDYSKDELRLIFSSPIFSAQGWSAPRVDFGAAWYWMPLLMFYTGARREELAQLSVRDVGRDASGTHFISILAIADENDAGRGVKTSGSRRMIPIHPDLLERGFLVYAQSLPGEGQLFPRLAPNPDGYYGANFGKRWAAYLREIVGLKSTASPSHGFRHTFKTLCREVGIAEDVHDAITGHAGGVPLRVTMALCRCSGWAKIS